MVLQSVLAWFPWQWRLARLGSCPADRDNMAGRPETTVSADRNVVAIPLESTLWPASLAARTQSGTDRTAQLLDGPIIICYQLSLGRISTHGSFLVCFFSDTDSSNVFAAVAKLLRDRETENERQNQSAFSCGNVRDDDDGGGGGGGTAS